MVLRTIKYYQLFCEKNIYGQEEVVGAYLTIERAKKAYDLANKGIFKKIFKTAKGPYFVREAEQDFDMQTKEIVF